MIHRQRPWLTVEELQSIVARQQGKDVVAS
jgi:hypothetical protein